MHWLDDISTVRLGSSDLDTSIRFATEIVGLELVRRDARRAYLRAGHGRDHHLEYVRGDSRDESLAFAARSTAELDGVVAAIQRTGARVEESTPAERTERHVDAMYRVTDPSGNRIELVGRSRTGDVCRYARDAGITSFSHVGLRTTDAQRDERFWTHVLGARVSDWIGDAPLLRLDEVHHRVALFPSQRAGVQHVNFQATAIDDIMRSYYFLTRRGIRVVFGPGRHPTSGAMFLYFAGPDDIIYEYSTGVRMIDDERSYEPRRFPFAASSFCAWGSEPDIPEFRGGSR